MLPPDQNSPRCAEPHDKAPYVSPLRITEQYPNTVAYADSITGDWAGMVYKHAYVWYLTTPYMNFGHPTPCRSKIDGFLLLQTLHKEQYE